MEFSSVFVILPLLFFLSSFVIFFLKNTRSLSVFSLFILASSLVFVAFHFGTNETSPYELLKFSRLSAYGMISILGLTFVFFLYDFFKFQADTLEYFSVFFTLIGSLVLMSAENLLMAFLGLEVLSIALYLFLADATKQAFKYLLFSGFATAISLFGLTLIFSENHTFWLEKISTMGLRSQIGAFLFAATFLFKFGVPPFHFWINDIYEKLSARKLAFFSSVPKIAVFIFLLKIASWQGLSLLLLFVGIAALFVGTLLALPEQNLNKIFGFSSIVQAGYLILSFFQNSVGVSLFFLSVYALSVFSIFLINDWAEIRDKNTMNFSLINAWNYAIFVIHLVGLPISAGFIAKIFLLEGLWRSYQILTFAGVLLATLFSFGYYGRILVALFQVKKYEKITSKFDYVLLLFGLAGILFGIWGFDNIIKFLNFAT